MPTAMIRDGASIFSKVGHVHRGSLLFVGATAAIIMAFSPRATSGPLELASQTPVLSSPASSPQLELSHTPCWVSGDLVGDANPATIAAALCGR